MKDQIEAVEDAVQEEATALLDTARKVLMASVGAVVMAGESAEKQFGSFFKDVETFVGKLVERGEIAEKDGRQLIADVVEKRTATLKQLTGQARETAESAEEATSGRIDSLITRLNVPTKSDIDTLTKKIGTLNRKVDQLKKAQKAVIKAEAEKAADKVAQNGSTPKEEAVPTL